MISETTHARRGDWRHMGVVDPCCYGRLGLVSALLSLPRTAPEPRTVVGFGTVQEALLYRAAPRDDMESERGPDELAPWDALMVHLPQEPQAGLSLLLQMGTPGVSRIPLSRLIVLSSFPVREVRRVLQAVRVAHPLHVINARLGVRELCLAPGAGGTEMVPPPGMAPVHLTAKERLVLLGSLQERSAAEQARLYGMNPKTVYGHKQSAIHKLGAETLRQLLDRFKSCRTGTV